MANVLLGVTGSVAAIYTPQLYDELRGVGHLVKVVATKSALHFFDPVALCPKTPGTRDPDVVILNEDEWAGERYRRGDAVLHIELRRWADVLLIAPLDANTLAKLANGQCDNCLTCVYRAWDRSRRVILAPAMNTLMWEHPATARHLGQIFEDFTGKQLNYPHDVMSLIEHINQQKRGLTIVPPVVKQLACDDIGLGALAPRADLLAAVNGLGKQELNHGSHG